MQIAVKNTDCGNTDRQEIGIVLDIDKKDRTGSVRVQ